MGAQYLTIALDNTPLTDEPNNLVNFLKFSKSIITCNAAPLVFVCQYSVNKDGFANSQFTFLQVEIKCMGQPVVPTLQLYNLVDLWLQTASRSERVPASIGSSAKDFVMVLAYARKVPDP